MIRVLAFRRPHRVSSIGTPSTITRNRPNRRMLRLMAAASENHPRNYIVLIPRNGAREALARCARKTWRSRSRAISRSLRPGPLGPLCSGGARQFLAQHSQRRADSGFYRPQRYARSFGNLCMRKPVEKRHVDQSPLVGRKLPHPLPHVGMLPDFDRRAGRVNPDDRSDPVVVQLHRHGFPAGPTNRIDGPAAGQCAEPAQGVPRSLR